MVFRQLIILHIVERCLGGLLVFQIKECSSFPRAMPCTLFQKISFHRNEAKEKLKLNAICCSQCTHNVEESQVLLARPPPYEGA